MALRRVLALAVSIPCQPIHNLTNFTEAHVATTSHDLHRLRRKPMEPFFSRLGVSRSWPDIAEVVECFARRIESLKGTGSVIRFDHACSAFAGDVIGQICFNKEQKLLEDPDFTPEWWVLLFQTKSVADMCQSGTRCSEWRIIRFRYSTYSRGLPSDSFSLSASSWGTHF